MGPYYYREQLIGSPAVVAFAQGDVTGDGIVDRVYLTGTRTPDSPFIQNITLLVQDGKSGNTTPVPLQENAGYNPRLFLGDFTGDRISDIMISIDSGGSGGFMYHYIYSFVNNRPNPIFDSNVYNETYSYVVTYKDFYKVEVISKANNTKYIIDLTYKGTDYLSEIYDENGKLKQPITGFVNPLSGLYPVDFDSNGVYELLAYQKIAGRYNADAIGYMLNTLVWKDRQFILGNQNVAILRNIDLIEQMVCGKRCAKCGSRSLAMIDRVHMDGNDTGIRSVSDQVNHIIFIHRNRFADDKSCSTRINDCHIWLKGIECRLHLTTPDGIPRYI